MTLEFTNKQFRRLLDLVYIGNWILNSTRGDDRIRQYDEVESLVFSQCLAHGMAPLTELYQGQLIPSQAFAEGGIHEAIEQYEDVVFYEILAEELALRDAKIMALQSQINPHFLYNTLESITWMVEAQENEAAVRMISELAKLLRVSLSRGKTIIPIKDELQHSRSYMNIQLARYKERFKTEFRIEEEIENCCIVKLVIQPILENAIYYGVGNMDEDDDGMIIVSGKKKDEDILITIEDNGMGMREEVLENILTDNSKVPKHGSGVGVINVHSRIRLMFGEEYGLSIESEPDEGTRVTIRIPAIPYTPENAEALELQKYIQRRPGG